LMVIEREVIDQSPEKEMTEVVVDSGAELARLGGSLKISPVVAPDQPNEPLDIEPVDEEKEALRRELAKAEARLTVLSRPLQENVSSAAASVEIKEGETLLIGGYPVGEANHEFAFITPSKIENGNGEEAVKLEAKFVELSPDFIDENEMGSIATNAKNTLQHAEAWMSEDAGDVLEAAGGDDGSQVMSAPNLVVNYGESGTHEIKGEESGLSFFAKVEKSGEDGFSIEARLERSNQTPVESWEVK